MPAAAAGAAVAAAAAAAAESGDILTTACTIRGILLVCLPKTLVLCEPTRMHFCHSPGRDVKIMSYTKTLVSEPKKKG